MNDWVRALGIDHGKARIGLAVSDEIGLLAHPLETVPATDVEGAIGRIVSIVSQRKIRDIVIGLPLHTSGRVGDAAETVREFTRKLQAAVSAEVRFHEMDESYTTVSAMQKLHEAGRTAKNSKQIIDQAAAVEILQAWLDQRAGAL